MNLLVDNYEIKKATGTALISDDNKYRYYLSRPTKHAHLDLLGNAPLVLFVMLNPSTADAFKDDATIIRCRGFADKLKAFRFAVVNLYAFRATKPADMKKAKDPVGPYNQQVLEEALLAADRVICAWGGNAKKDRVTKFRELAAKLKVPLWCYGMTKTGQPLHPLMLPKKTKLIRLK